MGTFQTTNENAKEAKTTILKFFSFIALNTNDILSFDLI